MAISYAEIELEKALAAGIVVKSTFFAPEQPQHTMRRLEVEVDEVVEVGLLVPIQRTLTLERRPAGSDAHFKANRLQSIDRPGVYVVRCVLGGEWTRTLELVAFTHEDLYGPPTERGPARPYPDVRLTKRGFVNDPNRTTEELIQRLEK